MIDTFEFITELEKAGIKEEGAKAIAKKFVEMQANVVTRDELRAEIRNVAKDTKIAEKDIIARIDALEARLKQEIQTLNAKIDAVDTKIDTVSDKLLTRIGGIITVAVGVIAWLNGAIHW